MSTLSRRTFIKYFAIGTSSYVCPRTRQGAALNAEIIPLGDQTGSLSIKISDYAQLANPGGSLLFKWQRFIASDGTGYSPLGNAPDPAIVTRLATTQPRFAVFSAYCGHSGCTVFPYEPANGWYRCHCHLALYNETGAATLTAPPLAPGDGQYDDLKPYAFEDDGNDNLTIYVPKLGIQAALSTSSNTSDRLRLEFDSQFSCVYQVLYRNRLSDIWQIVPFAYNDENPENGEFSALEHTELEGSGRPRDVFWVEKPVLGGFFGIQMKVTTGHPLQA